MEIEAGKDKIFISKCFFWKRTRSDSWHLLERKSEEGFVYCDSFHHFWKKSLPNPHEFCIWVDYSVRILWEGKRQCLLSRKGPCRGRRLMVIFTYSSGSSSVSLPKRFWVGGWRVAWLLCLMRGSFLQEPEKIRCWKTAQGNRRVCTLDLACS